MRPILCVDCTLSGLNENLALDEALLLQAEAGEIGETLRFWETSEFGVVLGSGCKLAEDVDVLSCRNDGIAIARRSSGGGTVLLGRGCLCFSLILAFSRSPALTEVRPSYEYVLGRILDALALSGSRLQGISDLTHQGYKFSGNAQQRKRDHLLHHGTILYDFDLSIVGRYLRQPVRQPEYRADRSHGDFLANLPHSRTWLVERLRDAWNAELRDETVPHDRVQRLVSEKYSLASWVERR